MKRILVNGLSKDFGGVESFFLNVVKNISSQKYRLDFICNDSIAARASEFEKYESKIYYVTLPSINKSKYKKEIEEIFTNNKYDIYHVNLTRYRYPLDIKIAKQNGVKILLHSHSTHIYMTNSIKTNIIRYIQFYLYRQVFIKNQNKCLACSHTAGKYLFGNKYEVLYNGINYDDFYFDELKRKKIRKTLSIGENQFVIGHVGRFSLEKNHTFMIDIMENINKKDENILTIFIGEGKEFDNIKKYAHQKNVENIKYLGFQENINDYLNIFDCFILPSKHEALPIALIEAQVNGLQCFVSDSITDEINIGNVEWLPIKNSIEMWALKILDCKNENKGRYFGNNQKFEESNFIMKLEEKYMEIINDEK